MAIGLFSFREIGAATGANTDDPAERIRLHRQRNPRQKSRFCFHRVTEGAKRTLIDEPLSTNATSVKSTFPQVPAHLLSGAIEKNSRISHGQQIAAVHHVLPIRPD